MADKLIITPVPALVAVLLNREKEKGSPLTEAEVLDIRDNAACVALTPDMKAKMDEARGYADIDPVACWVQWQIVRKELGQ